MSGDSKQQARRNLALRLMHDADRTGEQPGWASEALCALPEFNAEAWFPDQGSSGVGAVRKVCMSCPVRTSCLARAIRMGRNCFGVWGGTTQEERWKYLNWRRRQTSKM